MTDQCEFITRFLGCDYELFEDATDDEAVIARYKELAAQGVREGFFPLIVVGSDDYLAETLELALEDEDLENTPEDVAAFREGVLHSAKDIDAKTVLAERLAEYMETYGEAIMGEFHEYELDASFCAHTDGTNPHPELIVAKVPTRNPWELAAWIPMGGYNSCPSPAEQVAVFKYWYEKYGAVPAVVSHDEWELEVARPPLTDEDAEALAKEHFAFCDDRVVQVIQDADTVRALAGQLKSSITWYFWWD
jgi:hypothetical protein